MTATRQRLQAALNGETPDKTPLGIYSWMLGDLAKLPDDARQLVDRGLGLIAHVGVVQSIAHGTETTFEEKKEGNYTYHITRKKTPVGELRHMRRNGWHHEDWIKHPGDYKVWQWIVEHTEVRPSYDGYHRTDQAVGDKGIPIVSIGRTPAMEINIDIAGTERFCTDLALEVPELFDLYEAMRKLHRRVVEIAAAGPGRFVKWLENLTIGMLGPRRYGELLMSVYDECVPLLAGSGKRVMVHYDGRLKCIRDRIAAAPFHIVESLTEPPEGDMTFDQCRAAWGDKAFWANINVGLHNVPCEQVRQAIIDKRNRAGKRAVAFEISEDVPRNWRQFIPVVLDTLEELD
jgi:hypothetical protein